MLTQRLNVLIALTLSLWACGRQQDDSLVTGYESGYSDNGPGEEDAAPAPAVEAQEDQVAIEDSTIVAQSPHGSRVAYLTFRGGKSAKRCVRWNVNILSDKDLVHFHALKHEGRQKDDLKQLEPRHLSMKTKTVGGKDGVYVWARGDATLTIRGTVTGCDGGNPVVINETFKIEPVTRDIRLKGKKLAQGGIGKARIRMTGSALLTAPAGFYRDGAGNGYYVNDKLHFCKFKTFDAWLEAGGPANLKKAPYVPNAALDFDGDCK